MTIPQMLHTLPSEIGFWEMQYSRTEFGNIFLGLFTPVLAKHSMMDGLAAEGNRIQRNFEPNINRAYSAVPEDAQGADHPAHGPGG